LIIGEQGGSASTELRQSNKGAVLGHALMPPYHVLRELLDEEVVAGLLDYAVSRQSDFTPTRFGPKKVDPSIRLSLGLRDLGKFRRILEAKILDVLPSLIAQLRVSQINAPSIEFQLVAHGDGAFYKQHIDTLTAHYRDSTRIRVLSTVYYFNAEPKAFTGGALRLHPVRGEEGGDFVDIEPARNSLAVFLAWARHEVLPVSCPSKRFIDSRFAINCWVYGNKLVA
jgi:Rps23 Pro-64 3,4-dihydroxylase Tpa1-like proline 4-hydroxylase